MVIVMVETIRKKVGINVTMSIAHCLICHTYDCCSRAKIIFPGHGHSHDTKAVGHGHSHDGKEGHGHSHGDAPKEQKKEVNINVRAAFIHVIGDLVQSIGVLIAAIIIKFQVILLSARSSSYLAHKI